ncbi:MAG TPA: SGNH/GDSL hydrolase family protein [Acidimicrobiales bacterium]|nr:SGNH/GDSL hydrolase family protein [Acidimicrobiales bacterium]
MYRRVVLGAALLVSTLVAPRAAASEDPFIYVALGDSYTSGPLVLPHDTRFVPFDCGQSWRNYPHLVSLLVRADRFRDVSCGSATIDDFYAPQKGLPLGGTTHAQFDALGPNVDVVTVGVGGNDVGFAGDAVDCIRVKPDQPNCRARYVRNGVDQMSLAIQDMQRELGLALDEIHRRSARAAVFVVSYPTTLPDNRVACYPYLPIRQADMTYLVQKFKEMNRALRSAAQGHGATYVDIYTPSIGHDACKPVGMAWINGAVLVPPSFPAHPNELSYLHSAPVVARAIKAHLGRRTLN